MSRHPIKNIENIEIQHFLCVVHSCERCTRRRLVCRQIPPPVLDELGRQVSEAPPDQWPERTGVAMALCQLAPYVTGQQMAPLFQFFVDEALGDRQEDVRRQMLQASVAAVNKHGKVSTRA